MEKKTVTRQTDYYVAFDGKHFDHEDDCIAYESRLKMGISEITDTTFIDIYLERKDESNLLIPYVFTASADYSLLDYYMACRMNRLSYDCYKLGKRTFQPFVKRPEIPEYLSSGEIDNTSLIPGKKYILLYYKYGGEWMDTYGYYDLVALEDLDRVVADLKNMIDESFILK